MLSNTSYSAEYDRKKVHVPKVILLRIPPIVVSVLYPAERP